MKEKTLSGEPLRWGAVQWLVGGMLVASIAIVASWVIHQQSGVADGRTVGPRLTARRSTIAHLLFFRPASVIADLSATPEANRDSATWNDLAAAYDVSGDLQNALVAVDAALRIEPHCAEARFNRALILEHYHLRDAAADAWNDALLAEKDPHWKAEARRHRDALTRPLPAFASESERRYPQLARGDRSVAAALVRIDRGDARYFGEKDALGRWGEAWVRGDTAEAERHLSVARTLGASISRDAMLADAVAAIDRADRAARDVLARGHVAFRQGRRLYREERKPIEAERQLAVAARDLESGGSPMALEARVYTGVAILGQNRVREAEAIFESLDLDAPASYAALRGYVQWQLATCAMTRAQWGRTNALLLDAIATFERLGESNNTAYLHDILSQCYGIVGDRERAARHRVIALRALGQTTNYRLGHAVAGMVRDAESERQWNAALSFLDVEIHIVRRVGDKEQLVMALSERALLHGRVGETGAANRDLREVNSVLASVEDEALRTKLTADRDATAALVASRPVDAIPLLTNVLRFHETRGWRYSTPALYLRRGRMYVQLGDSQRAAADFETGIAEVETHRESLPAGEERWGVLDAANELFDEAIESALRRSPAEAFAYAERERARSIADTLPKRAFDVAALPSDAAIIEYAALPKKLIIFAADRGGYHVHEQPMPREELEKLIDRFTVAVQMGRHDRAAWDVLVAPVREIVATHRRLIFVPDALTSLIPFAALSGGQPLIANHTVTVAPSAGFAMGTRKKVLRRETLLIVDNPSTAAMPSLGRAASEGNAIERDYRSTRRLTGRAATTSAFLDEARVADIIHFAGHGIASADSAALLLASGPADAATLSRAWLSRTNVVVLASCDSARGPIRSAEGVLSVAHAFLQAGAPAVIATLWPIPDDESALFFPLLHRHLARGLSPAEALRLAQLEFISRNRRSTLWAAVQSIGR